MRNKPPAYVINPAALTSSFWTPEVYQIITGHRNRNYLNSLWLGTVWSAMSLPYRLFREVLVPLFNFNFPLLAHSLYIVPMSILYMLLQGVLGRLGAINLPIDTMMQSLILEPDQAAMALAEGFKDPLIEIDAVHTAASLDSIGAAR